MTFRGRMRQILLSPWCSLQSSEIFFYERQEMQRRLRQAHCYDWTARRAKKSNNIHQNERSHADVRRNTSWVCRERERGKNFLLVVPQNKHCFGRDSNVKSNDAQGRAKNQFSEGVFFFVFVRESCCSVRREAKWLHDDDTRYLYFIL